MIMKTKTGPRQVFRHPHSFDLTLIPQSKAILEKAKSKSKAKSSNASDETAHDDDDDDDDDPHAHKGPSVCSVDQSAITGESLASDKFIGDVAYYTCGVKRGKCYGLVTVPAKESFVGKTAALVSGRSSIGMLPLVNMTDG